MKTLILLISLIVTASQAATVRLYFTDPLTNEKDTNAFYITPIGTNVLSSGGVVSRGVSTRYVPAANGYRTNTLAIGHYSITNRSLGSGVVIRVPESSSLYDYTNILVSGYNIFVTITNGEGGTVQTNISYAAITNLTSFGALTNNDTRAVAFDTSLTIGAGSAQNTIFPSALLLTFSNSILASGSYIQGRSIIGTNFVGNGSSLTNIHGSNSISAGTISTNRMDATAYASFIGDVTQAGLAAGGYATGGKVRLIHNGVSTNSFITITGAKSAAVAGDLIWVEAGNYYENNLLKSNVNYHFMSGVSIAWTNATDTEFGIFDDRATGTTTNIISGSANLYWRSPSSTEFSYAGIMLTNSNTRFIASFGKMVGDSFSTIGEQPHIIHASGSNSWVSIKADELLTGSVNQSGQVLGGIVWSNGEMFVNITHIGEFAGYGIWPSDPLGRSTNNLWVASDLVECYIYADAANLNFRSWYDIKELRMTTNGTVKSGFAFFGGRHYVKCDKISSPAYFGASGGDGTIFYTTFGAEVWVDCQKLSRNGYSHTSIRVDSGAKLFANILHMEDVTTNTTPLIVNNGEMWLSGTYYKGRAPLISAARTSAETITRLSGVVAVATNDTAAIFADTNVTIVGSSIQTTLATNALVFSGVATNADIYPAKPFICVLNTNLDDTFFAGTSGTTITNWSDRIADSFTVNLVTGVVTNQVPGYYEIEVIQEVQTFSTADIFSLRIFRNGSQLRPQNISAGTVLSANVLLGEIPSSFPSPLPDYVADQQPLLTKEYVFLRSGDTISVKLFSASGTTCFLYDGRFTIRHL